MEINYTFTPTLAGTDIIPGIATSHDYHGHTYTRVGSLPDEI